MLVCMSAVSVLCSRIATFKDNFSFLAMTLDTSSKLHAVIWTQKGLPYDSLLLLPVPKPLGMCVCVCVCVCMCVFACV